MLQKTNMIAEKRTVPGSGIIAVVDRGVDHGSHARPGEDSSVMIAPVKVPAI